MELLEVVIFGHLHLPPLCVHFLYNVNHVQSQICNIHGMFGASCW